MMDMSECLRPSDISDTTVFKRTPSSLAFLLAVDGSTLELAEPISRSVSIW